MFPSLAEVAALFARGKEVQTGLAAMVSAPEFEGLEHDDGRMLKEAWSGCEVPDEHAELVWESYRTGRADSLTKLAECPGASAGGGSWWQTNVQAHWGDIAVKAVEGRVVASIHWGQVIAYRPGLRVHWKCSFVGGQRLCVAPGEPGSREADWLDDGSTLLAASPDSAFAYFGSASHLPDSLVRESAPCASLIELVARAERFVSICVGGDQNHPLSGVDIARRPGRHALNHAVQWTDGAPTGWARVPAQPNGLELVRRRWDASGVHDVPASGWDKPGMTNTPAPGIDPWSVGPDIERLPGP